MPAATPRASMPAACASSRATWPRSRCRSPRWRCGSRSSDLVGDDCGFESHGQVLVAENEEELASFRARVDDLRLTRLHARGADRSRRAAGAWCRRSSDHCPGGVVSRRDGAADPFRTTQAFRQQRHRAGRRGDRGRDGHRARAAPARSGGSRPAPGRSRRPRWSTPPAPGPTASPPRSASRCRWR